MPPYTPLPGDLPPRFGNYEILRKLGSGGMGTVYLARNTRLYREVALKVLRDPDDADDRQRERFLREARALAALDNQHICRIHDLGEVDDILYLDMEYLAPPSLEEHLDSFAGQPRMAVALVETLARALAYSHDKGVVHRDLKPANILFRATGEPVIIDWGLVLWLGQHDNRLTEEGTSLGTAYYMAPEQYAINDIDALRESCDIFGLGVILYELLTGQRPFEGVHPDVVFVAKKRGLFTTPSVVCPGIDSRLNEICRQALDPNPDQRFQGKMRVFADALAQWLGEEPATVAPDASVLSGTLTMTMTPTDPGVAEEMLALLRRWGWNHGIAQLRERIQSTTEPRARAELELFTGWLAAERGDHAEAGAQFTFAQAHPDLRGWACVGLAFVAEKQRRDNDVERLCQQATAHNRANAPVLRAAVAHVRGVLHHRLARHEQALECLYEALDLFGPDHLGQGRVLDSLGFVYSGGLNDFTLAEQFFERALQVKSRFHDLPGIALTHGQLGRLFLDHGDLDQAEHHLTEDLKLCTQLGNRRDEALLYNHLGRVWLARGQPERALQLLDESVRMQPKDGAEVGEAYARKDVGVALVALGRVSEAEQEVTKAIALFRRADFAEGMFHGQRALAQVRAAQGRLDEAAQLLQEAAAYFESHREADEAACCHAELARVQKRQSAARDRILATWRQALHLAERSRREVLVAEFEAELADQFPLEQSRWAYGRVRGCDLREDTRSLRQGCVARATVLFFDLKNSCGFTAKHDAKTVFSTLNQIFAELAEAMERHQVHINQYTGDGFMALSRARDHAANGVRAGLALLHALQRLNRARVALGQAPVKGRVGACSGDVFLGNAGTYRKLSFTAIGDAANRAARIQGEARDDLDAVCIGESTKKELSDAEFTFHQVEGRRVNLKGIGDAVIVWDVIGCK